MSKSDVQKSGKPWILEKTCCPRVFYWQTSKDVLNNLASASNAIIIGFNVRPDVQAKDVAEREKVDLRLYKVIYNAIEDIEAAMKGC